MDQHTGCKWLIHDTKHSKGYQVQRLELSVEYLKIQIRPKCFDGNIINPLFQQEVQNQGRPRGSEIAESQLKSLREYKSVIQNK